YYTAGGLHDAYMASYDTGGHYRFATTMSGSAEDQATSMALDSLNNIYVGGYTYSSNVNFGTNNMAVLNGNGSNQNIIFAKYDSSGQFVWSRTLGGKRDDVIYDMFIYGDKLYYTGYFHDTVDFDPSAAVADISASSGDIYL